MTSIPQEIIDLIAPHLNQHDLADCSRVSHDWSSLFAPWLWRTVHITNESTHDRFNSPESRAALIRNKHFVREVTATDQNLLLLLSAHDHSDPSLLKLTDLRALTLRFHTDAPWSLTVGTPPPSPAQEEGGAEEEEEAMTRTRAGAIATIAELVEVDNFRTVLELLSINTNLRTLRLGKGCLRGAGRSDLLPHIMEACPTTFLTTLEICFNDVQNESRAKHNVITNTTHLEDYQTFQLETRRYQDQEPLLTLKQLIFLEHRTNCDDFSRLAVLARCSHLVRLEFGSIDCRIADLLALGDGTGSLLRTLCPCLTELALRGVILLRDARLAALLRSSKLGWRVLELDELVRFSHNAYAVIVECVSTTLEVLRINRWRGLYPAWCSHLLSTTTQGQFRRLEGVSNGKVDAITKEFTVHAQNTYEDHRVEMARQKNQGQRTDIWSWIALGPSMEYLQLAIEGVPRPDVVCWRSGEPLPIQSMSHCHRYKAQKWIYRQLASMSGLQELILGKPDLNMSCISFRGLDASMSSIEIEDALSPGFATYQYDCLEFSLESGLDILSGLKELRVLDVKSTAHRIGVAELEWMRIHWPKLKAIEGLVSRREWAGALEDGEAVRDAVEAWIDKHPNGIGSSFLCNNK
ncbi:hypothetical protein BGZ96_004354 [Linnemannia gamsii]|uniref:F-box domain-containing protein n=1 Tax=Linnemannia gamsii TaxID=64522 RepID=A0ABQ7JIX5_9FUNG|nr:hypothetical protein BGZ96_004354 [Linnemannia gamsii]